MIHSLVNSNKFKAVFELIVMNKYLVFRLFRRSYGIITETYNRLERDILLQIELYQSLAIQLRRQFVINNTF